VFFQTLLAGTDMMTKLSHILLQKFLNDFSEMTKKIVSFILIINLSLLLHYFLPSVLFLQ